MYKAHIEQRDEALNDLPILQAEMKKAQKEASPVKREHVVLVEKARIFEINNKRLGITTQNSYCQDRDGA